MTDYITYILFTFLFSYLKLTECKEATTEFGVLVAETSTDRENFCIIYFKEFASLPTTKSDAKFHILQDESDKDWCEDHPESDVRNKVLLLTSGNCSVSAQAQNVYDRKGEGIVFITHREEVGHININATEAEGINMTVALISENSAERLKKMDTRVSVSMFAPSDRGFDFSLVIIFVISMFTVAVGSFWSGHIRFAIYCKEMNSSPEEQSGLPNKPSVAVNNNAEESSINVSPKAVIGYVICMGLMLVLLYFFFSYLVYFIIGLFVLASILSIHSCLEPLVLKINFGFCKAHFQCCSKSCNIDFRQVILVAFSIAVSVYWLIVRKEKYAWILQDILGVAFCIHMLKSIRLPSFKICTILLVLLFFYDIFFVFITPFFTKKGESVMEEVATGTGGKSEESIPMVLKVPHFGFDPLSVCYQQFSILGFGDLLVPGLLISYCHGFDLATNTRRIYFITTVITYAIGLLVTFGGLFLMNTAQPALLYLVPFTVIPPVLLALCRKELHKLWIGFRIDQQSNISTYPEVQIAANVPATIFNDPKLPTLTNGEISTDSVNDTHNERNSLLRDHKQNLIIPAHKVHMQLYANDGASKTISPS